TTRDSSYIRVVFHRSPLVKHNFSTIPSTTGGDRHRPGNRMFSRLSEPAGESIHRGHAMTGHRHPISCGERPSACRGVSRHPPPRVAVDLADRVLWWRDIGTFFARPGSGG